MLGKICRPWNIIIYLYWSQLSFSKIQPACFLTNLKYSLETQACHGYGHPVWRARTFNSATDNSGITHNSWLDHDTKPVQVSEINSVFAPWLTVLLSNVLCLIKTCPLKPELFFPPHLSTISHDLSRFISSFLPFHVFIYL